MKPDKTDSVEKKEKSVSKKKSRNSTLITEWETKIKGM